MFGAVQNAGFSQNKNELKTPRFGVKGGVNFANLYTADADYNRMITGFNVGLFGKLTIFNGLAVQPEINFATKGSKVTYNGTLIDGTALFNLNYVEIPLLFVVNFARNFNVHFGPYAAFLVSGKVSNESNVNLFDFESNINTKDYNRLDAGFAVGTGIDIGGISLGGRYSYGLSTVGKEKTIMGITYIFPDAHNGVINFYVSISIN
ncbi:MAG: hypothetical protein A2X22_05885 [Bacteroidetes bacterium GWF2_49_14]|nr:MAG: hypothetical protein A2X22_05885 [Bacteroidetes bacterium GWF2_49_14]